MRTSPQSIRFAEVDSLLRYEGFVLFNKTGSHRTYHHASGRLITIVVPHGRHKTCSIGSPRAMITSHHEYRGYVFTIQYKPQEPVYSVEFADFREIITSGDTLAEAFANACEALDLHLESLLKLGKRVPKPKHSLVVEPA